MYLDDCVCVLPDLTWLPLLGVGRKSWYIIIIITFIIHKKGNKSSIQPILKSNSTSFMFNNIFCEMKVKKVNHWGGAGRNGGTVLITSWKCNFSIYLDIQVYYLDIQAITTLYAFYWLFMCCCLLFSHFSTLQPLLKSEIFQHSKGIKPHSFQPTGIGFASLWRENRCALFHILWNL